MYYRRIHEPKEGEEVQYLAVYALRWPWDSGIDPTDAFVRADDPLLKAAPLLLEALIDAEQWIIDETGWRTDADDLKKEIRSAIAAAEPTEKE